MLPPDVFISTHLPSDPKKQYLPKPVDKATFAEMLSSKPLLEVYGGRWEGLRTWRVEADNELGFSYSVLDSCPHTIEGMLVRPPRPPETRRATSRSRSCLRSSRARGLSPGPRSRCGESFACARG
jgi:hypothetical protein